MSSQQDGSDENKVHTGFEDKKNTTTVAKQSLTI